MRTSALAIVLAAGAAQAVPPSTGAIWIRDAGGAVMVPCRMSERYNRRTEEVTGTATCSNIRQFKVTTTESIKH
jgi:hypothetical protein